MWKPQHKTFHLKCLICLNHPHPHPPKKQLQPFPTKQTISGSQDNGGREGLINPMRDAIAFEKEMKISCQIYL